MTATARPAPDAFPAIAIGPATLLVLRFQGYFLCRLATDPDPTNETRGLSGYTMALSTEAPLDRVIRLQADGESAETRLRPPAQDMGVRIAVNVTGVEFDGRPWPGHPLVGAHVRLGGRDEPAAGPTFESRNNITGSDDNFAFVVDPFDLRIESPDGKIVIRAQDYLDPAHPDRAIWEVLDPAIYGRRLPVSVEEGSTEVAEAINVFDLYGYFRDRRRYLNYHLALCEARLVEIRREVAGCADAAGLGALSDEREKVETLAQQLRSRLYQLEFWGDRVISKMGAQVDWAFDINGSQSVRGDLGGKVDATQPWPVRFWFGGWDGDLLVGYMRGQLGLPFRKDGP